MSTTHEPPAYVELLPCNFCGRVAWVAVAIRELGKVGVCWQCAQWAQQELAEAGFEEKK